MTQAYLSKASVPARLTPRWSRSLLMTRSKSVGMRGECASLREQMNARVRTMWNIRPRERKERC